MSCSGKRTFIKVPLIQILYYPKFSWIRPPQVNASCNYSPLLALFYVLDSQIECGAAFQEWNKKNKKIWCIQYFRETTAVMMKLLLPEQIICGQLLYCALT